MTAPYLSARFIALGFERDYLTLPIAAIVPLKTLRATVKKSQKYRQMAAFEVLKQMMPLRQIKAAELMVGQNNYSAIFAKTILIATPESELVDKAKSKHVKGISAEHIARMERELASLQAQISSVEDRFGLDTLHLTVAKGYLARLLGNARAVRWLAQHRPEYLSELQSIAEITSTRPQNTAAE